MVETRGRRMGGRLSALSRDGGCAFECGVVTRWGYLDIVLLDNKLASIIIKAKVKSLNVKILPHRLFPHHGGDYFAGAAMVAELTQINPLPCA